MSLLIMNQVIKMVARKMEFISQDVSRCDYKCSAGFDAGVPSGYSRSEKQRKPGKLLN